MTEQFESEQVAKIVALAAHDADYVHHLKLRTDDTGIVSEVPEIDGQPFPGIESIAILAAYERPTIAVIKLVTSVDFDGHAVIIEESEPEPPQAA